MKQFFGKKSRSALATVLMVSLVLHVVAIAVFGTIKLVSQVFREETVFEAAPIAPPPQKEPEYTVNLKQESRDTPPPRPPTIVVNNPNELDIPALNIDVDVDSTSVYGRGGGGFGGGLAGIREMTITANLFGKQIEANRLGVILDVSFSTHGLINFVIDEIQRNFPDALIVFAPGCGIDGRKNELVPLSDYEKTAKKYPGGKYVTAKFVNSLLKREGFEKIWKRTERQDLGFVVFSEIKGANGISGCDVAMKYLVDNGADVVYWFADFNDNVNKELADKAAGYMRRKGAKLMIHDFVPPLPGKGRGDVLKSMAKKTNGELFLKEFKKKK